MAVPTFTMPQPMAPVSVPSRAALPERKQRPKSIAMPEVSTLSSSEIRAMPSSNHHVVSVNTRDPDAYASAMAAAVVAASSSTLPINKARVLPNMSVNGDAVPNPRNGTTTGGGGSGRRVMFESNNQIIDILDQTDSPADVASSAVLMDVAQPTVILVQCDEPAIDEPVINEPVNQVLDRVIDEPMVVPSPRHDIQPELSIDDTYVYAITITCRTTCTITITQ